MKELSTEELIKEMMKASFLEDGCAFDESSLKEQPCPFFNPIADARYAQQTGKDYEDLTLRELEQFRLNRNDDLFFDAAIAAKYAQSIGKRFEDLSIREFEQFRFYE